MLSLYNCPHRTFWKPSIVYFLYIAIFAAEGYVQIEKKKEKGTI